jgi:hypothetical protein
MKTWKIRKFAGDVVYDLRGRGLLPVAAVLAVAMIAVPVLIARSGSDAPPPPAAEVASASKLAPENQAAVVAYKPGVREYKKRLGDLPEKDPFVQQYPVPSAPEGDSAASAAPPAGTTGGGGAPSDVTEPVVVQKPSEKVRMRYFFYETDVMVGDASAPLQARRRIDRFNPLPNPEAPVAVFLGTQNGGKKAVFLVGDNVTPLAGGGGRCTPTPEACQLLALGKNQPQDLVYAVDGKTYRIKVTRIELMESRKPPKS